MKSSQEMQRLKSLETKTGELGYGLKFWPGSLEALTESMEHLVCFAPPK